MYCDAHCDTLYELFTKEKDFYENDLHIDIKRMMEIGQKNQICAVWTNPKFEPCNAFNMAIDIIDNFYKEVEKHKEIHILTKKSHLEKDGIGIMLSIEGGGAIEGSLAKLRTLYRLGIRLMTLTWNFKNQIADGILEENGGGLSNFGKEVIAEMNRLNMLIDVSHINEKGFWDVCENTDKYFIASHSNAKTIYNAPRNLTDEQIKEIVKRNGFIGINLYSDFLGDNAKISDILSHIEHILKLDGEKVIGFGADFDGVERLPEGITGVQDMPKVFAEIQKNFGDKILNKIKYENFQRIVSDTLGADSSYCHC